MAGKSQNKAAVVVAHPDDETLWAGGFVLSNPAWNWFIATLCRASDPDRSTKFHQVLDIYNAEGKMADMDDGPSQQPLDPAALKETILDLLPKEHLDILITHSPAGEYTRHLRHEELGQAIIELWYDGEISADELWLFAYSDNCSKISPAPIECSDIHYELPHEIWQEKHRIITRVYGFTENGFEAQAAGREETFWRLCHRQNALSRLAELKETSHESSASV